MSQGLSSVTQKPVDIHSVCVSCTVAQVIRFVSLGTCKVILCQDVAYKASMCHPVPGEHSAILTLLGRPALPQPPQVDMVGFASSSSSSSSDVVVLEGKGSKGKGNAKAGGK